MVNQRNATQRNATQRNATQPSFHPSTTIFSTIKLSLTSNLFAMSVSHQEALETQ
jgi:hypothetical protein